MQKPTLIKNPQQEVSLITKRILIASILFCLLIGTLILRLAYLQIYKHNLYTTLSTNNWLDLVPLEPTRGLIYDRNGVLLVENIPVFSLDIIPAQIKNFKKTLFLLKKIILLSDNDISQFEKQLKQHRRFDEIPLKLRLTEEELARFTEDQYRFPGVLIKARLIRYYPYGQSFSHVIGYVGRINAQELNKIDSTNYSASYYIGKLGIEKYNEEKLHGQVGYEEVENDASGKSIRIIKEIKAKPGSNIYLTLDSGLQLAAEKALQDHRGAIVILQPATGQVLAMVSEPSYDPNLFVSGMTEKNYQALKKSQDQPLYDRASLGLYPLGSTIKPYLALLGLNTGFITKDQTIMDPGWFQLRNNTRRFYDSQPNGHGIVDLNRAIVSSCDIYFYRFANKIGIHQMATILSQFGFGTPTGIDLDRESPGILASPEWKRRVKGEPWYDGDTIISSIGQGFMQATPLQLADACATLANRGKRFMPYLLLGEQEGNKAYLTHFPNPLGLIQLKNNEDWEIIIRAMQEVITSPHGTAYRFGRHLAYTIAGKTGTAQVVAKRTRSGEKDNQDSWTEKLRDHHLFIAFAPVDHPKIALAIVTENSNTATSTARIIFDYYFGEKKNAESHLQTNATH